MELKDTRYNDIALYFDPVPHKYTDSLGNAYKSTTTILHDYQPKFQKQKMLRMKAKELGVSEKTLEAQWNAITKEAQERGTETHDNLERAIKDASMFKESVRYIEQSLKDGRMITVADVPYNIGRYKLLDIEKFKANTNNKYPQVYEAFDLYTKNGYKIYAEIGMFFIDYLISGTIDLLFIREDGFVIGDWKTNRGGLIFESGYFKKDKSQTPHQTTNDWVPKKESLLPPLSHLPNCNGSIYNLQLSMYAKAVETILGLPCHGIWLCHIDSDFELNEYGMPKRFPDGLYHLKENPVEKTTFYVLNYLRSDIERILNERRIELKGAKINTNKDLFAGHET